MGRGLAISSTRVCNFRLLLFTQERQSAPPLRRWELLRD
jgi:hypothetical protein